ncbi:hypothetical protein ASF02_10800 [Pseudomonas sp. Leaf58]|nr:hypothetical protein ASF02_10800 [Pseudomonas sp. Leaf58]
MSNRLTAGQLRREFLLRIIRLSVDGRWVNCKGGLPLNDDLKRLVAEGKVTLTRHGGPGRTELVVPRSPRYRGNGIKRVTKARPADGVYATDRLVCPCCGAMAPSQGLIKHADACSLRVDHVYDSLYPRKGSGWWHNKHWMERPNRA